MPNTTWKIIQCRRFPMLIHLLWILGQCINIRAMELGSLKRAILGYAQAKDLPTAGKNESLYNSKDSKI